MLLKPAKRHVVGEDTALAVVTLFGGSGNNSISGTSANDLILGNSGKDRLSGGMGDDFLNGEGDEDLRDLLQGESGSLTGGGTLEALTMIGDFEGLLVSPGSNQDTLVFATGLENGAFTYSRRPPSPVGATRKPVSKLACCSWRSTSTAKAPPTSPLV